jgi:hypothetical protein
MCAEVEGSRERKIGRGKGEGYSEEKNKKEGKAVTFVWGVVAHGCLLFWASSLSGGLPCRVRTEESSREEKRRAR